MRTKRICDGVDLRMLDNRKFKTNTLSIFFHIPLKRETVTKAALLPAVLKRGTEKYPEFKILTRHLADLYSAACGGAPFAQGSL